MQDLLKSSRPRLEKCNMAAAPPPTALSHLRLYNVHSLFKFEKCTLYSLHSISLVSYKIWEEISRRYFTSSMNDITNYTLDLYGVVMQKEKENTWRR